MAKLVGRRWWTGPEGWNFVPLWCAVLSKMRPTGEVACFSTHVQPHRLYGLLYTAVVMGMRRGELVALRWQDVDAVKNLIHVRRNAVDVHGTVHAGEPKTEASRRIIHVQENDIQILLDHKHRQQEERTCLGQAWSDLDPVFPLQLGTYLNPRNLPRVFERLVKGAKVTSLGIHGLRYTHASLLIKNGVDIGLVCERLSHTNPCFTRNVYTHLYDEQRSQTVLDLTNLLLRSISAGTASAAKLAELSLILPGWGQYWGQTEGSERERRIRLSLSLPSRTFLWSG